jgi:hypothetical protein
MTIRFSGPKSITATGRSADVCRCIGIFRYVTADNILPAQVCSDIPRVRNLLRLVFEEFLNYQDDI